MKQITLALSAAVLAVAGTALYAEGPRNMDPMGDKTVTRAEAAAKAGEMFDRMDANHDGKIDKADREARESAHFDKMDTDHNGAISREEFMAAHRKMGPGEGHQMGERPGGMGGGMAGGIEGGAMRHPGAMMAMFRMADTNKDNALSRDEFTAAVLRHFDMADANHDGKLTPEERKAAMGKMRAHMGKRPGMGGGMGGEMNHGGMDHGDMGDMPPPTN